MRESTDDMLAIKIDGHTININDVAAVTRIDRSGTVPTNFHFFNIMLKNSNSMITIKRDIGQRVPELVLKEIETLRVRFEDAVFEDINCL